KEPVREGPCTAGSRAVLYPSVGSEDHARHRHGTCAGGGAVAARDAFGKSRPRMPRLRAVAACVALIAAGEASAMPVPQRLAPVAPTGGTGAPTLHATPDERKLKLRVGETQRFVADAPADTRPRWTLDGAPVDGTAEWTFAPTAAQVGSHVVSLTTTAGNKNWLVRALPPPPPLGAAAVPGGDTVSAEVDRPSARPFAG